MNILPNEELNRLITATKSPCVSIFLPTHRSGAEREQDPIRFKNLLREAEQRLIESGLRGPEVRELLAQAQALQIDSFFWRHQNDGLAVFISPEVFKYFRLPLTFGENVFVGKNFTITPLLPLFIADGRFYILAISKKNIRLYNCTRLSVREVELVKVPQSIDELMRYTISDQNLTYHSLGSRGAANDTTVYHSHGAGTDNAVRKKDVLDFFYQVDRYLLKFLSGERAPMVLAGVECQQSIYREASSYPNLIAEGIAGSSDSMTTDELHHKAWGIMEPHFKKTLETVTDQFKQAVNTPRTSSNLAEIVNAAYMGRIEYLFVTIGLQKWGSFDPESGEVAVHDARMNGDQSLQNFAAIHTLSKGGAVYVVESREAPIHAPLSALYRY